MAILNGYQILHETFCYKLEDHHNYLIKDSSHDQSSLTLTNRIDTTYRRPKDIERKESTCVINHTIRSLRNDYILLFFQMHEALLDRIIAVKLFCLCRYAFHAPYPFIIFYSSYSLKYNHLN